MAYRFIEVEYTGKLADGTVFDTTDEKTAKEAKIHNPKGKYGPVIVCLGAGHLLKGLEDDLKEKKEGKYTISLTAEKAFGKKDPKLIQLIQTKKLLENNIKPFPGLQLNIDGTLATIKTVSGGRTMIDFNHPLSGKDVVYEITVKRDVIDDAEKAKSILELEAGISSKVELSGNDLVIKGIEKQLQETVKKRLSEFIDKNLVFAEDKSS